MKRTICTLAAVSATTLAALPLVAQAPSFRFADRTLVGFGADLISDGDFILPMGGVHIARLSGRMIAPSLDASALVLPGAGAFGSLDIGAGGVLQTRTGAAALLLRGGPSVVAGTVSGEGSGGVFGAHMGAALVVRMSPLVGLRLDITRRAYYNADDRRFIGAWGFGLGVTSLGRLPRSAIAR